MNILNNTEDLNEILDNVKQAKDKIDEYRMIVDLVKYIKMLKRIIIYGFCGLGVFLGALMILLNFI